MPELPEVETVKNTLIPLVKDKVIIGVDIFYDRLIQSNIDDFKKDIINKKILGIQRYGKYLFFDLSDDFILITHLRMEGKFAYHKTSQNIRISSTTLAFYFSDNTSLCFNDTRKFGLMYLTTKNEIHDLPMIKKLGIEANKIKESDYQELFKKLRKNKPIKNLITDQSILCGIGNIYADETLYLSKIHPLTKGKDLTDNDFINIFNNAKKILNKAITLGGSSVHSFSSNGIDGKFQEELLCYGKEGKICPNCGTKFHKIFLNGRGTTFCPNCQIYKPIEKAIGITGKIGSGKSTLLNHFKDLNYLTISSDELIKEIYHDPVINKKISKIVGFIFNIDNKEDRNKIKLKMINNPQVKEKIEDILYPVLENRLIKIIEENDDVVIEVPLLFKAHYEYMFKKIFVLDIDESKQIEHLKSRGDNVTTSLKINNDYSDLNLDKVYVIKNNSSKEELFKKVDEILNK